MNFQDQDVDNDLYSKRDGMDIVLWTLQRALRKKHTIGDPKGELFEIFIC